MSAFCLQQKKQKKTEMVEKHPLISVINRVLYIARLVGVFQLASHILVIFKELEFEMDDSWCPWIYSLGAYLSTRL